MGDYFDWLRAAESHDNAEPPQEPEPLEGGYTADELDLADWWDERREEAELREARMW